ncbi:hypothetical protein ACVOMS_31765 [Bradyrhizobium guangxiense]
MILVGHGRVEGARMAGLERVPVLRVGHLTAAQKIAFSLADNKIALNSDWDMDQLRGLWRELMGVEINFDVEVTGFETAEIDLLVDGETGRDKPDKSDLVPAVGVEPLSRLGDLWVLGEHRLLCGDACDPASFADLMDGEEARMVFTDPPYNVPIDGHVSGLGAVKHREFKMASGEMRLFGVRRFLECGVRQYGAGERGRRDPFCLHGLAAHGRGAEGGGWCLFGAEESVRLEQEQWRHGLVLPLQA